MPCDDITVTAEVMCYGAMLHCPQLQHHCHHSPEPESSPEPLASWAAGHSQAYWWPAPSPTEVPPSTSVTLNNRFYLYNRNHNHDK